MEYKINYKEYEFNITQNEDGSFNIPDEIKRFETLGTALKPANEPICVARKPLSEKTIAENVLKWGTGGINIDGCRIGIEGKDLEDRISQENSRRVDNNNHNEGFLGSSKIEPNLNVEEGRFPANIILDETAAELLDLQSGYLKSGEVKPHHKKNKTANGYQGSCYGRFQNEDTTLKGYGDGGGASRFFYVAKVSKKERNLGLDGFEEKETKITNQSKKCKTCGKWELAASGEQYICRCESPDFISPLTKNNHPTVKPINLLTYLVRLITPEGGIVLDPFMGSGSTGISALLEGFRFVGMEQDEDYFKIASARIEAYEEYRKLLK